MTKRSKEEYLGKLKDPRWQKVRLEVLDRDQFRCRNCGGETKTLHVHHPYYVTGREPWEYPASVLVTLCEECHDNYHTNREPDGRVKFEEWELLLGFVADLNQDAANLTGDNPDPTFTPDITDDIPAFLDAISISSKTPTIEVLFTLMFGASSGYFTPEKIDEINCFGLEIPEVSQGQKEAEIPIRPELLPKET